MRSDFSLNIIQKEKTYERGKTLLAGREEERVNGLRGRGSSAIWHHGGLEHRHA